MGTAHDRARARAAFSLHSRLTSMFGRPPTPPTPPLLQDHPFAQLKGSDNIIAFTTQRYATQPLIVRGPGAGAEVTAGGVFSDLLRLAAYLGAPS